MAGLFLKLYHHGRRMLLCLIGILAVMVVFSQFWALPSVKYMSSLSPGEEALSFITIRSRLPTLIWVSNGTFDMMQGVGYSSSVMQDVNEVTFDHDRSKLDADYGDELLSVRKSGFVEDGVKQLNISANNALGKNVLDAPDVNVLTYYSPTFDQISIDIASMTSSQVHKVKQIMKMEVGSKDSYAIERYVRKMRGPTVTLSKMNSMLLNKPALTTSMRRRGSSTRDRQLLSASRQIKNAPVIRTLSDLHAPLFRNVSVFKRSYDLMERLLKVYVYKEGEKPIFHNPRLRGLYAAEGWFMKLLERSKRFTVRDPKKAHLYYLPFSSETLRATLHDEKSHSVKDLERFLADYVDLIKTRYHFWNRTGGADHFFIACHDWGSRITRLHMSSCIRGLCNANVARGFSIGKDVSVPVTYIRSGKDPTRDIGGKPPSERNILAFFAGQLHGYLRPLLLQYWENKAPDMKIFGPMQRDIQGLATYRDYMKSSKYCICARGYEVHTPRVVESIFYDCVPVIISDNHVPPFFEVLDWESFAVFVQEKDIPNLRSILLSIPEERYLDMQQRIRLVQRHFIWHKTPEKYDLFHMILHSVWYNRVSQIRPA